jgi:hypothetical protein
LPAEAAVTTVFNSYLGGCINAYSSAQLNTNRFVATSTQTITAIDVYIGAGTQTNFSTARYYLLADNGGSPGSLLATFTPSTISGSGNSTLAKFTGSYAVSSGTKFWVSPAQLSSIFPSCYSVASASVLTSNGITVDTSVSGNNTNYQRAFTYNSSPISASWSYAASSDGVVWQIALEVGTPDPVNVLPSLTSGTQNATYRTLSPIRATVDYSSIVTFYVGGKKIPGCINIVSNAGTATCNWRPNVHGVQVITVKATPSSGVNALIGSSAQFSVNVAMRSNTR